MAVASLASDISIVEGTMVIVLTWYRQISLIMITGLIYHKACHMMVIGQ